ncbi:MAG TPA: hypothetical protein VFC68_06930, partial [Treponemataceae bacterium]|nr:hypothetical protein [Treponemataceae bacterium]
MSVYVIDFDVVAIMISCVSMYLYYTQKRVSSSQNRIFEYFLWAVFLSSVFGVASSVAINTLSKDTVVGFFITNTLFYLIHNSIPVLAALYVINICRLKNKPPFVKLLFFVPWAFSMGLILSNVVTGVVFTVENGEYRHGFLQLLLYD